MTATSRGIAGPEVTTSTHRFDARLRLYMALLRMVRGLDGSDLLTIVSLAFLFLGLTMPSVGFAVVGGLLVLLTPIGAALRFLIRGR